MCLSLCVFVTMWEREQGAIKVADIGHLYAELSVHIKWSERLEEEMWRQGDVEKARNMKVARSPLCSPLPRLCGSTRATAYHSQSPTPRASRTCHMRGRCYHMRAL